MEEKQIGVYNEFGFKYIIFGGVCGIYYSYVRYVIGYISLKIKGEVIVVYKVVIYLKE